MIIKVGTLFKAHFSNDIGVITEIKNYGGSVAWYRFRWITNKQNRWGYNSDFTFLRKDIEYYVKNNHWVML